MKAALSRSIAAALGETACPESEKYWLTAPKQDPSARACAKEFCAGNLDILSELLTECTDCRYRIHFFCTKSEQLFAKISRLGHNSKNISIGYSMLRPWHGSCDSVNAGGRGAVSQASNACVRERILMLTQSIHDIATPFSRRRWLAAAAGLVLGLAGFTGAKAADDTIKVGVLHSLSGTMAISETTLKDTVL